MSLGFSIVTSNQGSPVALFASTVPNAGGAGAGDAVTVNVSVVDQYGNGRLPASYVVTAIASQPATVTVSSKATTGFTLTLTPISSSTTLSAGTVDVQVIG